MYMWLRIELVVVTISIIVGFFIIMNIHNAWKYRRDYWYVFRKTAKKLEMEVKEGPMAEYGLPNLYGKLGGKEVYVHPVKRKKQENAVFAVSNSIMFEGDIVITSPETTELKADISTIKVPSFEREGLEVKSNIRSNRELVDKLFTEKEVDMLKKLVKKKGYVFRALIIEPGICMFSTYKIPKDADDIQNTLNSLVKLVKGLESNTTKEEVYNKRFQKVSRRNNMIVLEMGMMLFFLSTGTIMIISVPGAFSWIALNIGIILILISILRIFFIAQTRGWFSD